MRVHDPRQARHDQIDVYAWEELGTDADVETAALPQALDAWEHIQRALARGWHLEVAPPVILAQSRTTLELLWWGRTPYRDVVLALSRFWTWFGYRDDGTAAVVAVSLIRDPVPVSLMPWFRDVISAPRGPWLHWARCYRHALTFDRAHPGHWRPGKRGF